MKNEKFKLIAISSASGVLLSIPQIWMVMAPLQLIGFLPVLYLASKKDVTYRKMLYAGIYIGLSYVLPQAYVLRMPLSITLLLSCEMMLIFSAFSMLSYRLLRKPTLLKVFTIGAFFVLLDWINFTIVPVWGIAQSIVRPWSAYPKLVSFVSLTGLTGIAFLITTFQSLALSIVVCPKKKKLFISAAGVLIFTIIAANFALQNNKPVDKIKVSALGWTEDSNSISYPGDSNSLYAQLVKKAAQEGSKIVVSPEFGFIDNSDDNNHWFENFQEIAKNNQIALVIGIASQNSSKAIIIGQDGQILGDYTKNHLTPFDDYEKGDGTLFNFTINGINAGIMICNDDNFTDLSRIYGQKQTAIVAVPTWDWSQVKNAHFQSSINRAIESNYAVVRACYNGISAIISPRGQLIKKMDHLTEGSGIITGEVPLYSGRTLFSLWGHWPVLICFILLFVYIAEEIRPRISSVKKLGGLNI